MNNVTIGLILCGLLYSVSGGYRDSWQRDEDTIQKRFRDVVEEKSQSDKIRELDNNYLNKKDKLPNDIGDKENNEDSSKKSDDNKEKDVELKNVLSSCDYYPCYGAHEYCCLRSDGSVGCCYSASVYELWWFWMIWVALFFMILACSLACWRRRRAQYRYVVMANSEYPSYGTVVHTRTGTTTYSVPPGYQPIPSGAPAGPPGYMAQEKPPAYSS